MARIVGERVDLEETEKNLNDEFGHIWRTYGEEAEVNKQKVLLVRNQVAFEAMVRFEDKDNFAVDLDKLIAAYKARIYAGAPKAEEPVRPPQQPEKKNSKPARRAAAAVAPAPAPDAQPTPENKA